MYRFPANLDLSDIIGSTIHLIGLGKYQIQFRFDSRREISAGSKIEIWKNDSIIAKWNQDDQWTSQRFQEILEIQITGYQIESDTVLSIDFEGGYKLIFHDDSDIYETISIQPGNIFI